MEYLKSEYVDIKKQSINEIPLYVLSPKGCKEKYKTIIFYHGWGSSAKNQIFRANILASYGYQVVLPEARYHGERGTLDYEEAETVRAKMCQTIMHNIEEFPTLYKYVTDELKADEQNIVVSGHSMGAITASGLFTFKQSLKAAVLFNGACDWEWIVDSINSTGEVTYEMMRINEFMLQMNPKEHLENLSDRYLIMYNGEEDKTIDPKVQEKFYELAKDSYKDKSKIKFEKWEATSHQITTQMLEKAIITLKEELNF